MILIELYIYIYICFWADLLGYFDFFFGANFCWKGPKIVLVGPQKQFEWGLINFLYLF